MGALAPCWSRRIGSQARVSRTTLMRLYTESLVHAANSRHTCVSARIRGTFAIGIAAGIDENSFLGIATQVPARRFEIDPSGDPTGIRDRGHPSLAPLREDGKGI